MFSNLKYADDYTEFEHVYQLVLPLRLEGLVPNDDSVRLLSQELEELDYMLLYQAYAVKGRKNIRLVGGCFIYLHILKVQFPYAF